jgi:hypothetical protein
MSDHCSIEFRPITGYPGYRVGSDGSVWSCWKQVSPNKNGECAGGVFVIGTVWKRLKNRPSRTGYHRVALYDGPRKQHVLMVHHLVLTEFVGPRPDGNLALHRDDNKDNNSLANLYWGTDQENQEDRRRNGRMCPKIGSEHYKARLTEADVREIRRLSASGAARVDLARQFNATYAMICQIVTGKTWKHVA